MVRPRVFFDLSIDSTPVGRVIFELFNDTAPKTCENFRVLCTGEKGLSPLSERPLYYKSSIIHRSIQGFMIQGGDFTKRNGTGGESIYGGTFTDEDLTRPLDAEGLLCMANKGPNTNGSQFFVTLRECPHLTGKHVVFGRVIRGYKEVVEKIAEVPVDEKDRPKVPVVIHNCGELVLRAKAKSQEPEAKAPARPGSETGSVPSDAEADHHPKKRQRNHSADSDRSDVEHSDHDERERRHKKSKHKSKTKSKSKHGKTRSQSPSRPHDAKGSPAEPEEETEEQYDARLEREENERLEAAKRRELERLKKQLEQENTQTTNGVRFKGRGRMKFVDPEIRRS